MNRLTRTTVLPAVALTALLGLAACGDGGSTVAAGGGSSTEQIAEDAAFNAQDVAFAKDMKPHHEQAVEMADMILGKNPSPEIQALATKIKAAQEPEIEQLDALLAEFDVEADSAGGHSMGGMSGGSSMGMMSGADMQALDAAEGAEAERLFLEGMLEHHTGAVEMAGKEIEDGKFADAIALATTIKADQEVEIAEMKQLLAA